MLYKLHKLVPQPSRHYYPLENIRIIFHQSSSKADLSSLLRQQLSSRLESAFYLQNKTLSSSPLGKKVIMPPVQGPPHMNSERPGCLSLRNIQLLYQRLMRLCTPIILIINITTMRKIVKYFCKMFHYRCLTGF